MLPKCREKFRYVFLVIRINAQISIDERADKPRPDGALMVGGVAFIRRADVVGDIFWVARR
jgi:hypothetical protein